MKQAAAETLPAAVYRDINIYERERQLIFARSWLLVAHHSQVEQVGQYLAFTAAGYPLLVIRGDDNKIRAFHNVCRHRAGPLANEGPGQCDGKLVCHYHGWRYALDGRLASARDFGGAEGFDPTNFGLIAVRCAVWRGFVFINMDDSAAPLADFIATLNAGAGNLPLERFSVVRTAHHTLFCNWKTYAENYIETYHVPQIHPFLRSAIDAAQFEMNIRPPAILWNAPRREETPVSGFWAWLWPCLCVNGYANCILMERIWPVSVNETRLDYLYCFAKGVSPEEIDRTIAASETTTAEDKAICEAVQRNLNSGVYESGCLSPKHETSVAWFQNEIRRIVLD